MSGVVSVYLLLNCCYLISGDILYILSRFHTYPKQQTKPLMLNQDVSLGTHDINSINKTGCQPFSELHSGEPSFGCTTCTQDPPKIQKMSHLSIFSLWCKLSSVNITEITRSDQ